MVIVKRRKLLYGLKATGESVNGYPIRIFSKKLFLSEKKAKQHESEFLKSCMNDKYFDFFQNKNDVKEITIVVFELNE